MIFLAHGYTGIEEWLPEREDRSAQELAEIQRLVSALELSADVQDRAMDLLEMVRDRGLMRGRDFDEVLGAVAYIASRQEDEPRTMEEIAAVTGATKKRIGKAYRYIARNTGIRVIPPDPESFLPRFTEKLQLGDAVREQARELVQAARDRELLSGKSPTGTAATALFLSAAMHGEERTMKEVADLLDVTPVTIRERSREFVQELALEGVPDHIRFPEEQVEG